MRGFSRLLGRSDLEPPPIPPERMAQALAVLRRRVTDTVEDAFGRACLANDLATARDLVIVLDRMSQRGEHWPGGERRRISGQLGRMQQELCRCTTLQVTSAEAEIL